MPSNEERACARRCARAQSLDLRALVAASRYDFLVHSCASAACGACSGALESRHRLPDHSLARAAQTRRIRRSSRAHCEGPCEMQAQPSRPHRRSQVCARCRKKKIARAAVLAARHCPHARGITKGRCGRVAAGGRALRALVPARCGVRTQAARRSAVVAAEESCAACATGMSGANRSMVLLPLARRAARAARGLADASALLSPSASSATHRQRLQGRGFIAPSFVALDRPQLVSRTP